MSPRLPAKPPESGVQGSVDFDFLDEEEREDLRAAAEVPRPGLANPRIAAAGGVGGAGLIWLADALARDGGVQTFQQILENIGPILGPVYSSAPITLAIVGVALWLRAEAARKSKDDRRNARLVRAGLVRLGEQTAQTTQAVQLLQEGLEGLRGDVQEQGADTIRRFTSEREAVGAQIAALTSRTDARFEQQGQEIRRITSKIEAVAGRGPSRPPSRPQAAAAAVTSKRRNTHGGS